MYLTKWVQCDICETNEGLLNRGLLLNLKITDKLFLIVKRYREISIGLDTLGYHTGSFTIVNTSPSANIMYFLIIIHQHKTMYLSCTVTISQAGMIAYAPYFIKRPDV